MTLLISIMRWMTLLALFCGLPSLSWAMGGPSEESRYVERHGAMPFKASYLNPGGDLTLSMDWLSRPEERIMALTFDDGPDPRDRAIAALLKQHHISATFFYIGSKAKAMPGMVREILADRHTIGYHSYRHSMMSGLSSARLAADFREGRAVMADLGVPLTWFRPPYGDFNPAVVQAARACGMETILWTIDSRDWAGIDGPAIAKNVIRRFHPGAILLFHSIHSATLQALPEVVAAAEKAHYRLVSLDEWRRIVKTAQCRVPGQSCATPPPVEGVVPADPLSTGFPLVDIKP